jgi:hypothetical protein
MLEIPHIIWGTISDSFTLSVSVMHLIIHGLSCIDLKNLVLRFSIIPSHALVQHLVGKCCLIQRHVLRDRCR